MGPMGLAMMIHDIVRRKTALKANQLSRMSHGLKVSTWQRWNEGIANYWITHIQARERHVHFTHHSEDFLNRTEKPGVQMMGWDFLGGDKFEVEEEPLQKLESLFFSLKKIVISKEISAKLVGSYWNINKYQ